MAYSRVSGGQLVPANSFPSAGILVQIPVITVLDLNDEKQHFSGKYLIYLLENIGSTKRLADTR